MPFFTAIWGFEPFPWQQRLLNCLASIEDRRAGSADWGREDGRARHRALSLALEVAKGQARRAPIRIALIVDRRLIVDDAVARARHLSRALRWSLLDDKNLDSVVQNAPKAEATLRRARAEPVVKRTALRLCRLAGRGQPPLIARSLRGGAPREDDWARTPVQPT